MQYLIVRLEDKDPKGKTEKYLKRSGINFRVFQEKLTDIGLTYKQKEELVRRGILKGVNPDSAWETCDSCEDIWSWDNLGRGPYEPGGIVIKTRLNPNGEKRQYAGKCKNPKMLSYINCPMWCPDYSPKTLEGLIELAKIHKKALEVMSDEKIRELGNFIELCSKSSESPVGLLEEGGRYLRWNEVDKKKKDEILRSLDGCK